jgi:tRNA-specific 2-thiouridylase
MKIGKKNVFVAMSGGVDSSVAAALLKKQGYDVTGVFAKGWYPEGMVCGWKEERRDAIRAAAKLGIPFLTFDFSKEYEKKVVEYMKKEYAANRTPNPDVMCNKYIKFGLFLEKALKMGTDCIATGHYVKRSPAQIFYKINPPTRQVKNFEQVRLLIAKDKNKDQSYFLWTLTQEQLKYCLFPIGDYEKPEVRKLARKFGLPTAEKKDSQGLCFVGDINFALFLRKILPKKEGEIRTADGRIVGKHDGVHFYTIGQRHGLNIPGGPYYIVDKDLKNNILIVAEKKDEKKFYKKEIVIDAASWISEKPNLKGMYLGRIRYRQPFQKCRIISISSDSATIRFEKPQRAVTAGQSLVLYKGQQMLGGGIIV